MNKQETIKELDKLIESISKAIPNMPRIDGFLDSALSQLALARHTVEVTKQSVYNEGI